MANLEQFSKHPDESYPRQLDMTGLLPQGTTIAGVDVTATDPDGADATADVVGTSDVSGSIITYVVRGGAVGQFYDIKIAIALSGGNGPLVELIRMKVEQFPD